MVDHWVRRRAVTSTRIGDLAAGKKKVRLDTELDIFGYSRRLTACTSQNSDIKGLWANEEKNTDNVFDESQKRREGTPHAY